MAISHSIGALYTILYFVFFLAELRAQDLNCGISSSGIPPHSSERILNGHNISTGDHPWLVSIGSYRKSLRWDSGCGGTIISDRWILTAGHCETNLNGSSLVGLRVFHGSADFTDKDAVKRSIIIRSVFVHPDWEKHGLDIALLELDKPLKFNDKVQPICLVKQYEEVRHSMGVICGWGHYDNPKGSPGEPAGVEEAPTIAQETTVPIGNVEECGKRTNKTYDICAGGLNRGIESGDSGGPLMVNENGRWWQIGAISRNHYLGSDWHNLTDVATYARVSKACPWIEEITHCEVKCHDMGTQ